MPRVCKFGSVYREVPTVHCMYFITDPKQMQNTLTIQSGKKSTPTSAPLQAWSGPWGSRKLRFPGYVTKAQGGGRIVSLTHRPPLPPGNAPGTHFC